MRFIPAGAGNTVDGEFFIAGAPVYPRWRGEHDRPRHLAVADQGLSPLARGTLLQCQQSFPDCRFIPAGAGNTRRWHRQTPVLSVYPRWRGEHYRDRFWNLQRGGLSPLARGTHVAILPFPMWQRFIPAGAGNTNGTSAAIAWRAVYPRWRGEHFSARVHKFLICGLSPLARGTRPFFRKMQHR